MTAPNTARVQTGSLPQDDSLMPIQSASRFSMEDGTGTTKKSPLAVADTEIDMIVPPYAVTFVCKPVGADVRIAITDGGTAAAPYYVVKDGTLESFPVSNLSTLHFLRDAAVSLTLHFRFEFVG